MKLRWYLNWYESNPSYFGLTKRVEHKRITGNINSGDIKKSYGKRDLKEAIRMKVIYYC